ncbi:acetate and sugar kinases/Hsc70/actin family protein [Hymenobacter latericus]|uniref:hypothetical protein n=1 Tax=Hymenobacter sp. YIM 151858-1 TaxID=2987688 RepID=UPI00222750E7|nr:hypothetical protein [Hymenobacter sp. YIM 151858-1]UYZ61138.1 hypothetical protein OIS50_19405 [Hymenobacter sp. YIM 151858-1]
MKLRLLLFLYAAVCWLFSVPVQAQAPAATAWFELRDSQLRVFSGGQSQPLTKDLTLPNGTRLRLGARTAQLADGRTVPLREGDRISLGGVISPAAGAAPAAPAPEVSAPAPGPGSTTVAPAPVPAAFTYQPPAPVGGKLKGVVELGASGFNSFVVRIDAHKRWQLERSEFGNSLVLENIATPDDVRRGLKSYIGQMLDYGVRGQDIHFVVSSGALMADVTKRIVAGLKTLGYVVHAVTAEQEGQYGLRAALPAAFSGRAFVLDLGSGNTKLAWVERGQPRSVDTYGAKFFQQGLDDNTVAGAVRAAAAQVPAAQRATCFVLGGVPHELAQAARQGRERYTVLSSPAAYAGRFSGAKTQAGLTIYRAAAEATGCQQFVFDWAANFTIGYLLALP